MTVEVVRPGVALHMRKVGNEEFAERVEGNCHTCNHPYRTHIENQLVNAASYASIAREIADLPEAAHKGKPIPSARSISRHVEREHPVGPIRARRAMQEHRAAQIGRSLMDGQPMVDGVAYANLVILQGTEMANRGELKPQSTTEVINAAKFIQSIEDTSDHGYTQEVWESIFFAMYDTASRVLSEEDFLALDQAIQANPLIKMLVAKANGQGQDVQGEGTWNDEEPSPMEAS